MLEEWARQLKEQEREARAKTQATTFTSRSLAKTSKTPPASWSKFPSHNREERNAAAGLDDLVKLKDFAVKEETARGKVTWTTDKDEADVLARKCMVRSFSDRFAQPFKSRWCKLVPSRAATPARDRSMMGKRRSSLQTSGDLEYPELELLPTAGGYKELRALEKEISEMKRRLGSDTKASSDEIGNTARPSLTERMDDVAQHDGIFEPTSNNNCAGSILMRRPTSPMSRHLYTPVDGVKQQDAGSANHLTDSSGQKYATPYSHMSRSPCGSFQNLVLSNGNESTTTPPSPISSRNSVSVFRRSSMTGTDGRFTLRVPLARCSSWSGRGSMKRQATIVLPSPASP